MLFYLSFADAQGFRGACFVDSSDHETALWAATKSGLNLGGEVKVVEVPAELVDEATLFLGRTLVASELTAFGETASEEDLDDAFTICEHLNPVKGGRA